MQQQTIGHTDTSPGDQVREFMDLEELAARMGIGLTMAYQLAKQDALPIPVLKIGRVYRFSRRAYDALATAQHEDAATQATA